MWILGALPAAPSPLAELKKLKERPTQCVLVSGHQNTHLYLIWVMLRAHHGLQTLWWITCSGDSGVGVEYNSERTTDEEHIVHTEQPSLVFLLRGWALLSVGELELDTAYISLPHPWRLLTLLSAFLALSSLLIYRIMHQTSSRGDTVTQVAAPSADHRIWPVGIASPFFSALLKAHKSGQISI